MKGLQFNVDSTLICLKHPARAFIGLRICSVLTWCLLSIHVNDIGRRPSNSTGSNDTDR